MDRRTFIRNTSIGSAALAAGGMLGFTATDVDAFSSGGGIGIEEALFLLRTGQGKDVMPGSSGNPRQSPRGVFSSRPMSIHREAGTVNFRTRAGQSGRRPRTSQPFSRLGNPSRGSTLILPNLTWCRTRSISRSGATPRTISLLDSPKVTVNWPTRMSSPPPAARM